MISIWFYMVAWCDCKIKKEKKKKEEKVKDTKMENAINAKDTHILGERKGEREKKKEGGEGG